MMDIGRFYDAHHTIAISTAVILIPIATRVVIKSVITQPRSYFERNKMKETLALSQQKVSEIVKANPNSMSVLDKFGIDFCCGGKLSLEIACNKRHVNVADVEQALAENEILSSALASEEGPQTWKLDQLADYIVTKHHAYIETQIPEILRLLDKVCRRHGEEHPELQGIKQSFQAIADELTTHMKKEELILFHWIKRLAAMEAGEMPFGKPHFGTVANPIGMMEAEHENVGNEFETIGKLSNEYTLPEGGCMSFWQTYHLLKGFEADLHMHIHLENNILFPKAIALEGQLSDAARQEISVSSNLNQKN
jgi:regulator of cell morphogenesis and NO signaling